MNIEKEYFIENATTTFLYGTNFVNEIYDKIINSGLETYTKFSILYDDNRKFLTEKLGKQNFCTLDSSSRRLHVWRRDLDSGTYWIITGGNGRGSSYEIDENVDLNSVMIDIIDVYDLNDIKPMIEPFNLHRI